MKLNIAWDRKRRRADHERAAIMIAAFTAFTMGGFLIVQMLGFSLVPRCKIYEVY
jgi:hypothetical protein